MKLPIQQRLILRLLSVGALSRIALRYALEGNNYPMIDSDLVEEAEKMMSAGLVEGFKHRRSESEWVGAFRLTAEGNRLAKELLKDGLSIGPESPRVTITGIAPGERTTLDITIGNVTVHATGTPNEICEAFGRVADVAQYTLADAAEKERKIENQEQKAAHQSVSLGSSPIAEEPNLVGEFIAALEESLDHP